ncbi:MAG: hypothetical protein ACXIU7_04965 [Roseinatronobacter sp.]
MDYPSIVPILFMITLLGGLIFARFNKKAVEERRHDPDVPKSTLAKDGPQGGVEFLKPLSEQDDHKPRKVDPVID